MSEQAEFTVAAGAFLRGRVRRAITAAAREAGLGVEIEEFKALLASTYRVRLTGFAAEAAAAAIVAVLGSPVSGNDLNN